MIGVAIPIATETGTVTVIVVLSLDRRHNMRARLADETRTVTREGTGTIGRSV
jgi:hypothetical protein